MDSPKIVVRHLWKYFGDSLSGRSTVALQDIDLEVYGNEFLVIIGPSGCGKSTLLGIIAGLVEPTKGDVLIEGKMVTRPNPQKVAVMFQDPLLLPWRRVLGNVEFGLEPKALSKEEQEARALEYLKVVGLQGYKDYFPHQLSGGMRQRVALARALAMETEVLLMDEPFGALDEQTRLILGDELITIWSQLKRTVIFVTHSLNEAIYLGDRVAIMSFRPGRIKEIVDVDIARPRNYGSDAFSKIYQHLWNQIRVESMKGIQP